MSSELLCQLIRDGQGQAAHAPGLDWASLLAEARAEGVAPLVYWTLAQANRLNSLPEAARDALREAYAVTWMNNQRILSELETLARLFHEAGIPVVVLKGACFALTLYPDIGLRPMGDLDLLVPADRVTQAVQIATRLGYVDAAPEALPGMDAQVNHHVWMQKPEARAHLLEIHYSLVADKGFTFAAPVDWFWEQTRPLEAQLPDKYPGLRILSPEAQILYAAAHAMLQHGGQSAPLRWFYDLERLVQVYGQRINWQLLVAQARQFEWGSALGAYLDETVRCFGTPIPKEIRESLAAHPDRHSNLVEMQKIPAGTQTLAELRAIQKLAGFERLRKLAALLIPAPAYMRWRYGLGSNWQVPGAYLRRWAGILADGLRTLARLGKG